MLQNHVCISIVGYGIGLLPHYDSSAASGVSFKMRYLTPLDSWFLSAFQSSEFAAYLLKIWLIDTTLLKQTSSPQHWLHALEIWNLLERNLQTTLHKGLVLIPQLWRRESKKDRAYEFSCQLLQSWKKNMMLIWNSRIRWFSFKRTTYQQYQQCQQLPLSRGLSSPHAVCTQNPAARGKWTTTQHLRKNFAKGNMATVWHFLSSFWDNCSIALICLSPIFHVESQSLFLHVGLLCSFLFWWPQAWDASLLTSWAVPGSEESAKAKQGLPQPKGN